MTPFRKKSVKWDGNDCNGCYKNQNNFKYDIVAKSVVTTAEEMPEYFLADTPEEAESIYNQYESLLNSLAYSYAMSTKLSRADLFGEALIGLARAYRDWDMDRSSNFRNYAIFKIKDTLNEFVRRNSAIISVPAYIKKANANFCEIKSICDIYSIDWRVLVLDQDVPDELETFDALRCTELVKNLINASERAKVDYQKFIERVTFIPEDTNYTDQRAPEIYERTEEQMEAALIVEKLKQHMTDNEIIICNGIMKDNSFEQIGYELGKSKAWVSGKLKNLREKIITKMNAGTL